jgi:hypothetical protein
MTATDAEARNATALAILAAARRAGRDTEAACQLLGALPVEPAEAVATGIWLARWVAGRAGLNDIDYDEPHWAARTLDELRAGVTFNLSRDPEVARNRAVMLKILALVAVTTPDSLPPRESLSELLVTAAAQDAEYTPDRLVLWRIAELIATLADLDRFPGRLLDVLAADFMTTHNEGKTDAIQ